MADVNGADDLQLFSRELMVDGVCIHLYMANTCEGDRLAMLVCHEMMEHALVGW